MPVRVMSLPVPVLISESVPVVAPPSLFANTPENVPPPLPVPMVSVALVLLSLTTVPLPEKPPTAALTPFRSSVALSAKALLVEPSVPAPLKRSLPAVVVVVPV